MPSSGSTVLWFSAGACSTARDTGEVGQEPYALLAKSAGWSPSRGFSVQHDMVARFYGGYDQVGMHQPAPVHISRNAIVIGIAGLVLFAFVAADVSAFENPPVLVKVSNVNWYILGTLVTTSGGFTIRASQSTYLSLTCTGLCFEVVGVSVSSPFTLVNSTVVSAPVQWVNLTVKARSTAYDGNLSVTLAVP